MAFPLLVLLISLSIMPSRLSVSLKKAGAPVLRLHNISVLPRIIVYV